MDGEYWVLVLGVSFFFFTFLYSVCNKSVLILLM